MESRIFNQLSLNHKTQNLYTEGTFVTSIRYYGYKINLFLYKDFYVEVFYNHKFDQIEKIELLDFGHTRMKFYTDQIRLSI